MGRSLKIVIFPVALALGVAGAVLGYEAWKAARYAALRSCVNSTASDAVEYGEFGDLGEVDRWHVLSEEEASRILIKTHRGDCNFKLEPPADMNARRFKVAIRKTGDGSFNVRVWSNGFDNIGGTEDDIVSPYGEKALPSSY